MTDFVRSNQTTLAARTIDGIHDFAEYEFIRLINRRSRILDLGCGTGAWASRMMSLSHEVTCVDRDSTSFALNSVPFVCADLNEDFAEKIDGLFPVITAIEVIEHLENPRHFLRQCKKLLDDKGLILVTTPNIECVTGRLRFLVNGNFRMFDRDERLNDPTHISPIQTYMFQKMVKDVELKIVRHSTSNLSPQISRPFLHLIRFLVGPFLSGIKGGDIHLFVLSRL